MKRPESATVVFAAYGVPEAIGPVIRDLAVAAYDDAAELRLARAALRPSGAVLVFGPALEWLYSELDLLRRQDITGSTLWAYHRVTVPLSRWIQRLLPDPPLGKNVVLIACKP